MIYEHLIGGVYTYTVTDTQGHCIGETYSRAEAEQLESQYRLRLHSADHPRNLYYGILADPIRSK